MPRKGVYYLGRVIKTGNLRTSDIQTALREPQAIERYGFAWTFLDVQELRGESTPYVFGRLVKYDPDAEVSIVDTQRHEEVRQPEPNMTRASSPFVYIPEYSGIAFLHISSKLEYKSFLRRWPEIVDASHRQLLAQCDIDPITDLRTFARKLQSLQGIYRVAAKVHPPNPLFGPLWKELKEYLKSRNTSQMQVQEDSGSEDPISTNISEHVQGVIEQTRDAPYEPGSIPIGDAAILMAADGYGRGYIRGKRGDDFVVIRTSETVRNFTFERDPDPEQLYEKVVEILSQIEAERHMEH